MDLQIGLTEMGVDDAADKQSGDGDSVAYSLHERPCRSKSGGCNVLSDVMINDTADDLTSQRLDNRDHSPSRQQ